MPNSLYACKKYQEPVKLLDLIGRKVEMVCASGHLARDPERTFTSSNMSIAKFSLAVSWGKRGEDQVTEWVQCVAFKDQADLIAEQYHKGMAITVIGKLNPRTWTGKDGVERTSVEVQVWEVSEPVWRKREAQPAAQTQQGAPATQPDDDSSIPF